MGLYDLVELLNVRAMIGFSFQLASRSYTSDSRARKTARFLNLKNVSEKAVGRARQLAALARQQGQTLTSENQGQSARVAASSFGLMTMAS